METTDNKRIKRQVVIEIEELRHKLENLIRIKEGNFDNEVLRTSRKLDEVLIKYYNLQLKLKM
jgi:hypothetical protein